MGRMPCGIGTPLGGPEGFSVVDFISFVKMMPGYQLYEPVACRNGSQLSYFKDGSLQ
jgi:hypothetical protein